MTVCIGATRLVFRPGGAEFARITHRGGCLPPAIVGRTGCPGTSVRRSRCGRPVYAASEASSRSAARRDKRLALELANPFAGEIQLVTDRLERPRLALEAEAQLEDPPLPLRQRVESPAHTLAA